MTGFAQQTTALNETQVESKGLQYCKQAIELDCLLTVFKFNEKAQANAGGGGELRLSEAHGLSRTANGTADFKRGDHRNIPYGTFIEFVAQKSI